MERKTSGAGLSATNNVQAEKGDNVTRINIVQNPNIHAAIQTASVQTQPLAAGQN